MTTDTRQRSVLVFGKSQLVLDHTVAALNDLGYTAQATNDFLGDVTSQFDVTDIDLVVLGTQVPASRQAELKEKIGAINPRASFSEGLAGIPGLIVSCVQEAFAAGHQDPAQTPAYTAADRSIRLTLPDPAAVKVTVWWRVSIIPPDPSSASLVLLDGGLARGPHTIPVPGHVFLPPERSPDSPNVPPAVFTTVQIDAAIYNFGLATGP